MVGTKQEESSKGPYDVLALPLLTGQEEMIDAYTVKYVREGEIGDMLVHLISQVGFRIRIFRGHELRSIFAPQAGVRYDGLYVLEFHIGQALANSDSRRYRIRQYGHKLDVNTEVYRLELILERLHGQRPMYELRRIPRPSQLDDWKVYERLESDKLKRLARSDAFLAWRDQKEHEKDDKIIWEYAHEFRPSMSGISINSRSMRPHRPPARDRVVTRYFDLGAEHGR